MRQNLISSSFKYKEQDPSFLGDRLDEKYRQGPVEDRKCTDLLCCLLFLALIAGMAYVGYLGFKTGNPMLLASPFDEDGKQCGVDPGYEDFQKVFISFMNDDPTDVGFVCVKACPGNSTSTLECIPNSQVPACSSLRVYPAETVVSLCYPSEEIIKTFDFNHYMDVSVLQKYFSDLKNGWPLIGICVGFAFVVSMLFTVFIKLCAGCFVWTIVFLFFVLSAVVGTLSFLIGRVEFLQKIVNYEELPANLRDADYQLVCAILCWSLAALELLMVCCFLKQIRMSIGILKAAADFTREQCYAFLIPVCITVLQVGFFAGWLVTLIYVFSSNESDVVPVDKTPFAFVEFNRSIQLYTILYVFGLLWITFFLEALGSYWTSSSVAIWYFEQGQPRSPITRSVCRSFKQLGSLAFGSLVVAVVVFIRAVLEYITKTLKQQTLGLEQQAAPAKFCLKCAACCIACFERVIRFLTNNAYIMMAISGDSFCTSAQESFYLILRSTAQFAVSHGTTAIFILFGKLTIVTTCCVCGYLLLTTLDQFKTTIYSPIFLTVFFSLSSFPVASAFLSLFESASNTILVCYSMELDLMNGNNPKCPPALKNFLRNYANESVASSQDALR